MPVLSTYKLLNPSDSNLYAYIQKIKIEWNNEIEYYLLVDKLYNETGKSLFSKYYNSFNGSKIAFSKRFKQTKKPIWEKI